ncbi:hypothetical protein [Halorhabdus sp. CUG00001]|uniref:hypothetical protein n=1 Tax=Halorhabdus sp. CUG00001 TaxID=2600297 RepID=UPI00131C121A|nr:hypothetical protein [Halorhabdus sp. CUG00001]
MGSILGVLVVGGTIMVVGCGIKTQAGGGAYSDPCWGNGRWEPAAASPPKPAIPPPETATAPVTAPQQSAR